MSSFYGISPNQKPFVFDRIYGSYISALAAASAENGDGVYPGRYILIEYEHKDSGVNYNQEENAPTIYDQNKGRDNSNEVPTKRKNYDSTVWMKKTFKETSNNFSGLEQYYVNVAELNSPSISLKDIDFGYEIEDGKTLKDLVYTGDTIPLDEITFSSLLTDGQLTQPLNIHIQSIGHIMNTAYNLLYGKNRNDIEYNAEDEDIDYNTNTKSMLGSINYVNKLLKEVKNSSYPGLGDNNDYLSVEDDGKLHHVNKSRGKNVIATFSVNNFSIGKTTNNVLEVNATSEDIQTDSLGHIIDITSSSTTNLIDLSIGAVPKSGNTETKRTTIWGNIGYTSSSVNTLWGKVSSINSSITSITNIIGSSNTTTDTGTLWDNIHNINNIIGSSDKEHTLWGDIQQLWNNIEGTDSSPGGLWGEINSINTIIGSTNLSNTLWGNINRIDSSVASISNSIGSSSDPTNTTTVWGKINRIDSIVGTTIDTSDKNTLYGKIKKIEEQEVKIYTEIFYEPQYIPSYPIEQKGISPCFQKVTNIITNSIGDTSSFVSNTNSSNAIYTLSWDGGNKTSPSPTVTASYNGTTYIGVYNEGYLKNRKYTVNYKEYSDNTLECDGIIENVCILYGQEENGNIISPYCSYYKDSNSEIQEIDKTKTYASMTTNNKNNTATVLYLYPVIFNTYSFFRENNNKYSFSRTPTVTIEVFPQNSDINNSDSAIIQTEYTTKKDFSLKWIHSSSSPSATKTSNDHDGYLVANSPYKNFKLDYGMIMAGDGVPQNWTTASDVENSPYTKANANTYYTIHFTARGTKSS